MKQIKYLVYREIEREQVGGEDLSVAAEKLPLSSRHYLASNLIN